MISLKKVNKDDVTPDDIKDALNERQERAAAAEAARLEAEAARLEAEKNPAEGGEEAE